MALLAAGEIVFDERATPFAGAAVHVRLEEVSEADAAAVLIAEEVTRDVTFDPVRQRTIAFAIHGAVPDQAASYLVRVHIDVDGDGVVSSGDFISTQSHPVLTHGYPRVVTIPVRQVS